tara:strand:- start:44 stop:358 length:315 start_codon:yes stop_codon:yes gene_type:complete
MSNKIPYRIEPGPIVPTSLFASLRWVEHHIDLGFSAGLEWVAYSPNGHCAGSVYKGWDGSDVYHIICGWPINGKGSSTASTLELAKAMLQRFDKTGQEPTGHHS